MAFFIFISLYFLYENIHSLILVGAALVNILIFFNRQLPTLILTPIMFGSIAYALHLNSWRLNPETAVTCMLVVVLSKLHETKNKRDFSIVIYCFFLILAGAALYNSSLTFVLFAILATTMSVSFFMVKNIHQERLEFLFGRMKDTGLMALAALPIIGILFFFFPRFQAFFPNVGTPKSGQIGYSQQIKNDQIESLALSSEIVMRVQIDKKLNYNELYWRGSTLERTDGYNWYRTKDSSHLRPKKTDIVKKSLSYSVKLEKPLGRDLITLDQVVSLDVPFIVNFDQSKKTIKRFGKETKVQYQATSILSHNINEESRNNQREQILKTNTQLTTRYFKGTSSLFEKLNKGNPPTRSFINNFEKYIKKDKYIYTLNPGRSINLDQFVKVKKGFCTHFSSLLAVLLRMKKVPVRLVSGFQGGEYNKYGKYYIIRSNDAHTWIEYLEDSIWKRVDPTSFVDISRIQLGGQGRLSPIPFANLFGFKRSQNLKSSGFFQAFNKLKLYYDNINYQVAQFLDSYNRQMQKALAKSLKIKLKSASIILWFGLIFIIIILSTLFVFIRYKKRQTIDYFKLKVKKKLTSKGLNIKQSWGPHTICSHLDDLDFETQDYKKFFLLLNEYDYHSRSELSSEIEKIYNNLK